MDDAVPSGEPDTTSSVPDKCCATCASWTKGSRSPTAGYCSVNLFSAVTLGGVEHAVQMKTTDLMKCSSWTPKARR